MNTLAYSVARFTSRCCICHDTVRQGEGIAVGLDSVEFAIEGTAARWAHQNCAKKRVVQLNAIGNEASRKAYARRKGIRYEQKNYVLSPPVKKASKNVKAASTRKTFNIGKPRLDYSTSKLVLMNGSLTRDLVDLALAGECDYSDVASRARDLSIPLRQLNPPVGDGTDRRAAAHSLLDDVGQSRGKLITDGIGYLFKGLESSRCVEGESLLRVNDALPVTPYEIREHQFLSIVGSMRLAGLRIDEKELGRQLVTGSAPAVLHRVREHLRDGRIHPTMDATQASGRLSVSNPAMLTFGRRGERLSARRVVVPEDGHVFLSVDLSQIEPRVVAALSQDSGMLDAFDAGVDLHASVACELFGGLEHRTLAKRFNNAVLYGAGLGTLLEITDLPKSKLKSYLASFVDQFPDWLAWRWQIAEQARTGALLDNHHGRKLRVLAKKAITAGPATVAQSCARDIFVDGVLRIHSRGLSTYLRLLIHDEVLLSVPENDYADVAREVQECMTASWMPVGGVRQVAIEASLGSRPGSCWADVYEGA